MIQRLRRRMGQRPRPRCTHSSDHAHDVGTLLGNPHGTLDNALEAINWESGSPPPGTQVDVQVVRLVAVFGGLGAGRQERDRVNWGNETPSSDVPR